MRPIQIIVSYRLQKDEEVFNHPCNSNLSKNNRIFGTLETINSLSLSLSFLVCHNVTDLENNYSVISTKKEVGRL